MASAPRALLGLDLAALTALMVEKRQPAYRGRQLFQALYRDRVTALDAISTLPGALRASLREEGWEVGAASIRQTFISSDGTERYLISFPDGESVETVWMPEGDGGEAGDGTAAGDEELPAPGKRPFHRATICVSSQVGCAMDCRFCLTAQLGLKRHLSAGEIAGQVLAVLSRHEVEAGRDRINLVFMGQGEPFHNYDNFIQAVRLLVSGAGLAESRMTVSTSGIVTRIADLGREAIRPKLAISLNASNDADRSRLMPINRKWDIAALRAAAREFPLRRREKLTFEYVLLAGENDGPENAREVAAIVRGLPAKVNLIAWNAGPGAPFRTPDAARVLAFQKVLTDAGVPAFVRRPRGRDIYAACGQLKQTVT
jgi:23S rRNA (adenine2503-C2)-methyltransferase